MTRGDTAAAADVFAWRSCIHLNSGATYCFTAQVDDLQGLLDTQPWVVKELYGTVAMQSLIPSPAPSDGNNANGEGDNAAGARDNAVESAGGNAVDNADPGGPTLASGRSEEKEKEQEEHEPQQGKRPGWRPPWQVRPPWQPGGKGSGSGSGSGSEDSSLSHREEEKRRRSSGITCETQMKKPREGGLWEGKGWEEGNWMEDLGSRSSSELNSDGSDSSEDHQLEE